MSETLRQPNGRHSPPSSPHRSWSKGSDLCLVSGYTSHTRSRQDWTHPDRGSVYKLARTTGGSTPRACSICQPQFRPRTDVFVHLTHPSISARTTDSPGLTTNASSFFPTKKEQSAQQMASHIEPEHPLISFAASRRRKPDSPEWSQLETRAERASFFAAQAARRSFPGARSIVFEQVGWPEEDQGAEFGERGCAVRSRRVRLGATE